MQYGHFDNENREYVIDRVDLPVSWTNYIGTGDMMGVFNHTAGGYLIYKSSEYHRITRFRPNGVPMDFPGHYVYLRDEETGEFRFSSSSFWFSFSFILSKIEKCPTVDGRGVATVLVGVCGEVVVTIFWG